MHLCEECDKPIERCICEDEYCHDCHMDNEDYGDDCYVDPEDLKRHSNCCGAKYLAKIYPECADDDHDKMMEQIGQKRKRSQPALSKKQLKIRQKYLRKRQKTEVKTFLTLHASKFFSETQSKVQKL